MKPIFSRRESPPRGSRRWLAATAAWAVVAAATLSGVALTTATTPAHAADPLTCGADTIYNLENSGGFFSTNYRTGANTEIATFPNGGAGNANSLGVNADGTRAYNYGNQTIGIYNRTTNTFSTVVAPITGDVFVFGGAVNPKNGMYYVAGSSPTADVIYGFNPVTGQWLGELGSTPLQSGAQRSGDIAFDNQGNLYILQGGSAPGVTNSILVAAASDVPAASGTATFPSSLLTNLPGAPAGNYNGIAFASDGYLYAQATSDASRLLQVNPNSGVIVSTVAQSSSTGRVNRFGDLAGCATPPVLTAQKSIAGRVAPTDQFTLAIERDGTPVGGGSATTSGASTGLQSSSGATAGPVIGLSGTTYTVRETAAAGSGANMALYATTFVCRDQGRIVTSGSGQTATVTIPTPTTADGAAVNCIFENTPASYTVAKTVDVAAVVVGQPATYSVTVTNTGPVAYTTANPASFTDDLSNVLDDAMYNNDASEGATVIGSTLSWSGTLAVGQTRTITYSVTPKLPDGSGDLSLVNAVTPTGPGGTCATAGGCATTTPVQALQITKTADQTDVVPGQQITYTVTVENTGSVDYTAADPAAFSDDLSAVLDDATWNADAVASAGTVSYAEPTLSWSGPVAAGATVTVTYSVTVNDPPSGDSQIDNAVTSTTPGNNCPAGNTDPACIVRIPSGSFTVEKSSSATVVNPGDTVTYTVTVTNTGAQAYTTDDPASFSDDLSAVLDDATYNDDATNGATVSGNTLTWSGALGVGESVQITYSVTVGNPVPGDQTLTNTVVPTSPGGRCATAGECTTTTTVRSYTVEKSSSAQSAVPGAVVTYTVTVKNTGTAAYPADVPASFTDDLSAVLDDAAYNGDAAATAGDVSYSSPTLSWSGALDAGASVTVTYSVTVNTPGAGDGVLTNAVTPTGPAGTCATDGGCTTTTPVQAFTVAKTASAATAIPGSVLTYTVTVTNTGQVAYTADAPASFTDDLTAVLDDATYNDDATDGATVSGNTLTWAGALPVGDSVTVTYSVTVNQPNTGDNVLTNAVTPTGPGGACATDGGCVTNTPVQSIVFTKTADTNEVIPGSTVTYTITATNTGQVDYTADAPATFTDDLSAVLDDATYNGDATASAGTVSYAEPTLSWSGPVAIGATATITYSVTVNTPDTGDSRLTNTVVSETPGGNCPTGSDDPACVVQIPSGSFSVEKSASSASVTPGSVLTYTVMVTNTGQVDYTTDKPASFSDDLSAVLDDASYNGDAAAPGGTGVVSFTTPTLSWTGPLPVGATVTVTYSVTVNQPNTGDNVLTNAVTPTGPGGACATDGGCVTNTPVQSIVFTKTADTNEVIPGSTVTYTITATNTGQVDYTADAPATFTDDLSAVLDDATYNGDAATTGGAIVYAEPTLTWAGPVAIGQTVTITYTVTVNDPDTGDKVLANTVVSDVPGSNCVAGTGDPDCTSTVPAGSYSVSKQASTTSAVQGSTITYTVTVTNTGNVAYTDATPASFRDNLTQVLDDATYTGDATTTAGTVSYTAPNLSWKGPLPVGQAVTVTYSVTVNSPDTGDRKVVNAVVPTGPGGSCAAGACTTSTDVPPGLLVHTGGTSTAGVAGLGGFGAAVLALLLAIGAVWSVTRRQVRS